MRRAVGQTQSRDKGQTHEISRIDPGWQGRPPVARSRSTAAGEGSVRGKHRGLLRSSRPHTLPHQAKHSAAMKITAITATPLWAPRRKFFGRHMTTAQTAHQPAGMAEGVACVHALILISTDNQTTPGGITGIGEVCTCWSPDGQELAAIIDRTLAPLLIGADPFNIAALAAKMDAAIPGTDAAPAKAALEMALYDIVGKALQVGVRYPRFIPGTFDTSLHRRGCAVLCSRRRCTTCSAAACATPSR